tara:strand:- start:815 stop:1030 length:216 start_codon:yes stop_codon:yes gene_type:complete
MKCSKFRQQLKKKKSGSKTPHRCKCTGTFVKGRCKELGIYRRRREEEEQMVYNHAATTIQIFWKWYQIFKK